MSKAISNAADWNGTYRYDYSGQSIVEERNSSDKTLRQYVWGTQYTDELVQIGINDDPGDTEQNCETFYYAMQDANYNVLGIVNSSGDLKERYEYTPYGQRTVYKSAGGNDLTVMSPLMDSQQAVTNYPHGLCDFGHQGLLFDKEFGLYYDRARYLDPTLGRMMSPDRKDYVDGMNRFEWERSNPVTHLDPTGLRTVSIFIWVETAGRPNDFILPAVEARLKADVAAAIVPPPGDSLTIALGDRTGCPTDLGWKYDMPGGSYNAGGWDWVPFVNFGTKLYRTFAKKKTQYEGYVRWHDVFLGWESTANYITTIDKEKADVKYNNIMAEDKNWTQTYSNALAHGQLHLGAYGGSDWLFAPAGHIAAPEPWVDAPFTVQYGNWASKFLRAIDLK